jgi:hypothetical protein
MKDPPPIIDFFVIEFFLFLLMRLTPRDHDMRGFGVWRHPPLVWSAVFGSRDDSILIDRLVGGATSLVGASACLLAAIGGQEAASSGYLIALCVVIAGWVVSMVTSGVLAAGRHELWRWRQ